ncbi:MAG: hypothetical protein IJH12_05915 [Clostridia bacterium]|nr:hypothetical protein [Clostridia bacterium]
MENDKYIEQIKKCLSADVENIELVSQTSNIVFKVQTKTYGTVYAKFYINRSSHIDNEMHLYGLINPKYLKEIITSSNNPKLAIFKELRGKTLDMLTPEEIREYKDNIVDSLIYFYETIGKSKAKGYGLLDENMNGTSPNFQDFIIKRQTDTQNVLKDYPILNNAFSQIIKKYGKLITEDNSLVPIDTNAKNVIVTESGEVKFIDPGELISAPILMGYGDFVAHTYKTELYDCLLERLKLSEDDKKRLHIYAIFSSLNVLAFLRKLGVENLKQVIPYGNKHTFYSLIVEHLKELGIE